MEHREDYKAAVGPSDLYDIIGARQFCIMVQEGLREYHTLLDIGCGSLRGGRFFMVYLNAGNYYGIEPNQELVEEGLEKNLCKGILAVRHPTFYYSDAFDLGYFLKKFNFILAQSIFSHANQWQIATCLKGAHTVLTPNGKFIFTYFKGQTNYQDSEWRRMPSATYREDWIHDQVTKAGFKHYQQLKYSHPAGQTWVAVQK